MPRPAISFPAEPVVFICIPTAGDLLDVFFVPERAIHGHFAANKRLYEVTVENDRVIVELAKKSKERWPRPLFGQIRRMSGRDDQDMYVWWEDRQDQPFTYTARSKANQKAIETCRAIKALVIANPS